MNPLPLFKIKELKGVASLALFHAAAELGIECIIVTSPATTFVSTGFFDNARAILNSNTLINHNLNVFRRRIGGGVVLLGPDQVFYQVVLKRNNPAVPRVVKNAYRKFSTAPMNAFRRLGVPVTYRPINDLVVEGTEAKISGQGAGAIEDCFVFVGNLLIDFDYRLMADILNVADDQRSELARLLKENVSTLTRELGEKPDRSRVADVLAEEFSKEFPKLHATDPPDELLEKTVALSEEMTADDFVYEETDRTHDKIKIREGVYLDRI